MGLNPLNLFGLTGLIANKFRKKDTVTAPAPTDQSLADPNKFTVAPAAPPPLPVSAPLAMSTAIGAAQAAQQKAKKRAASGSTLLTATPAGKGINPPATLTKKSLIGY